MKFFVLGVPFNKRQKTERIVAKIYEIEINDTNTNSNQRPQETKIINDWKWRKQLCQMKKKMTPRN